MRMRTPVRIWAMDGTELTTGSLPNDFGRGGRGDMWQGECALPGRLAFDPLEGTYRLCLPSGRQAEIVFLQALDPAPNGDFRLTFQGTESLGYICTRTLHTLLTLEPRCACILRPRGPPSPLAATGR